MSSYRTQNIHYDKNISIPPRSQIIQPINVKLSEDSVILNEEIQEGVFIGSSIAPAKGIIHIHLMNTNNYKVMLNNFVPKYEPASNYNVLVSKENLQKNNRFERLKNAQNFMFKNRAL